MRASAKSLRGHLQEAISIPHFPSFPVIKAGGLGLFVLVASNLNDIGPILFGQCYCSRSIDTVSLQGLYEVLLASSLHATVSAACSKPSTDIFFHVQQSKIHLSFSSFLLFTFSRHLHNIFGFVTSSERTMVFAVSTLHQHHSPFSFLTKLL